MRKIIHIDMDAFYASVEQRDQPHLRGKPVIIGGDPSKRGVVCTCSYEARKYGIHSAMPTRTAKKLCPNGTFIFPRMEAYKEVSQHIRNIFYEYTDLVEPLSLDEAYLDVTLNKKSIASASAIATEIRHRIKMITGLTASAGVSFNKFLAKVASDINKPNGMTVITPSEAAEFIDRLPIRKFFGIGRVTEKRMRALGIHQGRDLKKYSLEELCNVFGKMGLYYYNIAHGNDKRPVDPSRNRKSMSKEITFEKDITDPIEIDKALQTLSLSLEKSLEKNQLQGKTVTLKIRYADFTTLTRSSTLTRPVYRSMDTLQYTRHLLQKTEAMTTPIRLLGIGISNFPNKGKKEKMIQLEFEF